LDLLFDVYEDVIISHVRITASGIAPHDLSGYEF